MILSGNFKLPGDELERRTKRREVFLQRLAVCHNTQFPPLSGEQRWGDAENSCIDEMK
jgi:hypothetical protein